MKKEKNINEDFYPSQKPCPIMEAAERKKSQNHSVRDTEKTKIGRRKLFQISFEVCRDLKEVYPAYTKREAKKLFLKDHQYNLEKKIKDSIKIREISEEEFEREFFRK